MPAALRLPSGICVLGQSAESVVFVNVKSLSRESLNSNLETNEQHDSLKNFVSSLEFFYKFRSLCLVGPLAPNHVDFSRTRYCTIVPVLVQMTYNLLDSEQIKGKIEALHKTIQQLESSLVDETRPSATDTLRLKLQACLGQISSVLSELGDDATNKDSNWTDERVWLNQKKTILESRSFGV